MGDKINESQLQLGAQLAISFDLESREFNGKWYTEVKAWKVASSEESTTTPPYNTRLQPEETEEENDTDLPF